MIKNAKGSGDKGYGLNNISKIESNDSISSSISSISLYSLDSRSNSNEIKFDSNENLYDEDYKKICDEEYKNLIKCNNNFFTSDTKIKNIPLRTKRREREAQSLLSKSPQLSDALKIIEKCKSYYNPNKSSNKIRSYSFSSTDYYIGDINENKCE